MTERAEKRGVLLVVIAAFIVALVLGAFLTWAIRNVPADRLATGLTNVATVGGIVNGLSLSGTAVLSLSGRYRASVLAKFGGIIRAILFGGFSLLVTLSLLSAVSVLWINQFWPKIVLACTVSFTFVTLVTTALLINSAFSWAEPGTGEKRTPDPFSHGPGTNH